MATGMSISYADQTGSGLPEETRLLAEVSVRLVANAAERRRHDHLLAREHYLGNARAVVGCYATWPNTGASGWRC